MEQRPKWRLTISIAAILALTTVSFFGGIVYTQTQGEEAGFIYKAVSGNEPIRQITGFDETMYKQVWNTIRDNYVDSSKFSQTDLFYGSLKGLAEATGDPYTIFMTPKESKAFDEDMAGAFEGIGAEIGIKNEVITVIAPLDGTPAQKAGLKAGDKIIKINDEVTVNFTVNQAVAKIRGPKGTEVVLTIVRDGVKDPLVIKINRDLIQIKSVKTVWKNKTLIITVSGYNDDTDSLFAQAVDEAVEKQAQGVILDLRNNPGGYLDSSVAMVGNWVTGETAVVEKMNDGTATPHLTSGSAKLRGLPTVVLVNQGSASAAEITAGALQDYGLATIVGETTYGKGSVQVIRGFDDGSSLKITIAKWFTPKDRSIDKEGIKPDVEVLMTQADYDANRDPQMDKALETLKQPTSN